MPDTQSNPNKEINETGGVFGSETNFFTDGAPV